MYLMCARTKVSELHRSPVPISFDVTLTYDSITAVQIEVSGVDFENHLASRYSDKKLFALCVVHFR